ncbi:serine/threonine-protein kinase STY17 [Pelomyxa schiedti]|nr:serine/threonine-protein kinase STY17 [Pelomyxa schiedti]
MTALRGRRWIYGLTLALIMMCVELGVVCVPAKTQLHENTPGSSNVETRHETTHVAKKDLAVRDRWRDRVRSTPDSLGPIVCPIPDYLTVDYECCDPPVGCTGSRGEWVQLVTVPHPPWKFTSICIFVGTSMLTDKIQLSLYEDDNGVPASLPFSSLSLVGENFESVNVSDANFTVWDYTVFVGVSFNFCDPSLNETQVGWAGVVLTPTVEVATSYFRVNRSQAWSPLWLRSQDGVPFKGLIASTFGIHDSNTLPPAWTCDPSEWNDGNYCNCGCGLFDLDCYNDRLPIVGCASSLDHSCIWNGTCSVVPGTCTRCDYGSGDGCQCGTLSCGSPDPDCNYVEQPVYGCPDSQQSCHSGICGAPVAWLCSNESYFDDVCSCMCGVSDPACDRVGPSSPNCSVGQICKDALCVIPGWTCASINYNAHDGCDCSCGVMDPDCNCTSLEQGCNPTVWGCCNQSQVCSSTTACVNPGVCGNHYVDSSEDCDGGLGCSWNCHCDSGYSSSGIMGPYGVDCIPDCGDGIAVIPEQCDGGVYCLEDCTCQDGFTPYTNPQPSCGPACNNSVVDTYEECDGGDGCLDSCRCAQFWDVTDPISRNCQLAIVGPLVFLGVAIVTVLVGGLAAILILRHYKRSNPYKYTDLSQVNSEICKFAWEREEYGCFFDKKEITFGTEDKLLTLDKESHDSIVLTNTSKRSREFTFQCPDKVYKYDLKIEPSSKHIGKGESHTFHFRIVPKCTAELSFNVTITCSDIPFNIILPVTASVEQSLKLDADEIVFGDKIGEGTTGNVFKATWRGFDVAVKAFPTWYFGAESARESVENEIEISMMLRSPFTVTFYGFCLSPEHCFIVMEMMEMGNLDSLLQKQTLDWAMKMRISEEIAQGMCFLHRNRVLHRDLKPANVLISTLSPDAKQHIKISDFGTARIATDVSVTAKYTACVGTLAFTAPEVLSSKAYDWKADVYSYGVLIWCIITQQEAYSDQKSTYGLIQAVCGGTRPPVPDGIPPSTKDLMCRCWAQNPSERPDFSEIVGMFAPICEKQQTE